MVFWSKWIFVSAVLAGLAWHYKILDQCQAADLRAGAGIVAQIGATMLGFVFAALAILASVTNTRLIRNMQRTGHYQVLLRRMFGSIAAFGLLTVAGLIVIFLPTTKSEYAYALTGITALSVISLFDVLTKFWKVLYYLRPETPPGSA